MKTQLYSYIQYIGVLLCSMLLFFSCSKNSGIEPEPDPIEKEKVATATFSKLSIQAYPTTFPGYRYDHISIMNEHIYVIDYESKKFRRYSLTSNKWEDLASENSLHAGILGYLTAHKGANNKNILVYLGGGYGKLNVYYPSEYPDATLRDSWVTQIVMTDEESGERGAVSNGEYIYFIGNSRAEYYPRQIDRYVPAHDLWEKDVGSLPEGIGYYSQAVFADNKLFVTGDNSESESVFFVYDLLTQKTISTQLPFDLELYSGMSKHTMVIYQDYLIYMLPSGGYTATSVNLYVYDLEKEQWLENHIAIEMDLFTRSSDNASLLLSSSGKLYAAGTKAGDFVLYEVDFSVTEE